LLGGSGVGGPGWAGGVVAAGEEVLTVLMCEAPVVGSANTSIFVAWVSSARSERRAEVERRHVPARDGGRPGNCKAGDVPWLARRGARAHIR
jgi:hypothetical protein